MDTCIRFTVKGLGFPVGGVYKMHVWFNGRLKDATKWVDNNTDKIKKELKDVCYVHSIEYDYLTYSNTRTKEEEYGNIILNTTTKAVKTKKKGAKTEPLKKITDISRIDFPNLDKKDLERLGTRIVIEKFKRKHELSDSEYSFYVANQDLIKVEDVKEIVKKHGTKDKFVLRKQNVRKIVEEKVQTS